MERMVAMEMRCSVYLRPTAERQAYIDAQLDSILVYFRVADKDKTSFLAQPEIREMAKILRAANIHLDDALDYLGESFIEKWTGGDENE